MALSVTIQDISNPFTYSSVAGPLASLEGPVPSIGTYVYPADLGSSKKNHYVKFSIRQVEPTQPLTNAGISSTIQSVGATLAKVGAVNYNPNTTTIADTICLYMPDTLTSSYNASYDELSLTSELGTFGKGVQAFTALKDVFTDQNKGAITSADPFITNILTQLGSNLVGAHGASDAAIQQQGYAINPQMQMIFRGMDFRQFQLSFLFTPSSSNEAATVNQIITTFKYHFSPSVLSASNAINGMFFVPPAIFNLQFMFNASENLYLPKYGDCVLRDIDVNYAPNGFAAHNDGAPVQTQLTMTFQEIEIVTKEKIKNGYNSGTLYTTNAANTSSSNTQSTSGTVAGLR
jgi:hypothetical protein